MRIAMICQPWDSVTRLQPNSSVPLWTWQVAQRLAGQDSVVVGKVNVDEQQELAQTYSIVTIPTMILFKNGEPVSKNIGLIDKEGLKRFLLD